MTGIGTGAGGATGDGIGVVSVGLAGCKLMDGVVTEFVFRGMRSGRFNGTVISIPVPIKATACGLPGASSCMKSEPEEEAATMGANRIPTMQCSPEDSFGGQAEMKSKPSPVIDSEDMFRGATPVLLMVSACISDALTSS